MKSILSYFNKNSNIDSIKENKETKENKKLKTVDNIDDTIYVYTDGSCINNGKKNAKAGYGIYFGENDKRNVSKRVVGKQTNNVAELTAIIETYYILEKEIKEGKNINIYSDSQISIGWCTYTGEKYFRNNWKKSKGLIPNLELIKKAYFLFKNKKNIKILKVKAHTNQTDKNSIGNFHADRLANESIGLTSCPHQNNTRIYLNVPYSKKDILKPYGIKWDNKKKKWYIYNNLCIKKKNKINELLKK